MIFVFGSNLAGRHGKGAALYRNIGSRISRNSSWDEISNGD